MVRSIKKKKQRGGILINGESYEALKSSLKNGSFNKLGNNESLNGVIIRVELPPDSKTFISTNTETMGQPVDILLLKILFIRPSGGQVDIVYKLDNNNESIYKETVNKKSFIREVAVQHDVYTKTNYFGEPLCPSMVGTYILKLDDPALESLSVIKDIRLIIDEIATFAKSDEYRVGIIAMELLENYQTLSDSFTNLVLNLDFGPDQMKMIAAMYAFLRLSCLGYNHNDLHRNNIMINPFDSFYAGKGSVPNNQYIASGRAMIIDFGQTEKHDDSHLDILVGERTIGGTVKISGFAEFYNSMVEHIKDKGDDREYFFTEIRGGVKPSWFHWDISSFLNHISRYMQSRRKVLQHYINSGLLRTAEGVVIREGQTPIAPINYSNIETTSTIHGFNGIISDNPDDIDLFEKEYSKLRDMKGLDLDLALIIPSTTSAEKPMTIRQYLDSPIYKALQDTTKVPDTIRNIIVAYTKGERYYSNIVRVIVSEEDEKKKEESPKAIIKPFVKEPSKSKYVVEEPVKKALTPPRRVEEKLFDIANAREDKAFANVMNASFKEIRDLGENRYEDADYILKKRSALLKLFRDILDTPVGRFRIAENDRFRDVIMVQLRNTIDFAEKSSKVVDNTEFIAYIKDFLNRISESQYTTKVQSRKPKSSKRSNTQKRTSRRSRNSRRTRSKSSSTK